MKPNQRHLQPQGFALVVTLSLMILLTIIAVGLLTLSSISLRSAGQGEAMAVARNNARLALMMALGDLQRSLGPDKAVSATSGILSATPGKPNVAGAWESWDFNPSQAPDYTAEKSSRFRRWLVSSANPKDVESRDFVNSPWGADPEEKNTATLVGKNATGGLNDEVSWSRAGKVPISRDRKISGAYAWHVSDESVKARINLFRDPNKTTLAEKRSLLAGHRPAASVIKSPNNTALDFLHGDLSVGDFALAKAEASKIIDMEQISLQSSPGNLPGKIRPFRNDVTPYSLGVMTNVRTGGLMEDLSSVFEMTNSATTVNLPTAFTGKRLYESTHGITGVSDPFWSNLAGYYNLFRVAGMDSNTPTFYQRPTQGVSPTLNVPPRNYYPGPVIAKVEALFSYVTRDSHSNWVESLKSVDPKMLYMGHLIYTPLVTLHNPYNVSISFDNMEVVIRNVPVGFNFYVNGKAQNTRVVSINDMFVNGHQRGEKSFYMKIANWSSPGSSSTRGIITMKPGETLVCAPYLSPSASFSNPGSSRFFDWENNLTGVDQSGNLVAAINARPGFYGRCIGFDVDWVTPTHGGLSSGSQTDGNRGVLGLRADDQVFMEYAVQQPTSNSSKTSFDVTAKITAQGRTFDYGGLSFTYQNNETLKKHFPQTYRYPITGSFRADFAYVPNTEGIGLHANAQTVAVFSAYARTTSGGVYNNGSRNPAGAFSNLLDGKLAGRPFLFHNPARTVVRNNLQTEKPGVQSHELNFQPFLNLGQVEDTFTQDSTRTNALTGNTGQRGVKSGSYLELQTGPMQTIADFRRSNALTSVYLPSFTQPVANSFATPLMSTSAVKETNGDVASYELLDHSTLANHAFYDRFYFSTFATVNKVTPEVVFNNFMTADTPLPSQAFQPYLPIGVTASQARTELFSGGRPVDVAHKRAAEFQMIRGPFNVNSTSVQAWKAILASMSKSEVMTLWAKNAALEGVKSGGTPILPMSLPNGGIAGNVSFDKIDDARTNEWNGYRELSETELDTLAQRIVEEVRLRGPFLSMSDFVNRRVGENSDLTRMGALESAIAKSQINDTAFKEQVTVSQGDLSNPAIYPFKTIETSTGNPAAGAPGWITQGDLMRILEPAATVRSDTFVIRVCGEARDATGKVTARAYAEAIVQRVPDYVDPANRPSVNVYTDAAATAMNKQFGRRMSVVSFRWMSSSEV
jgi:hypothetical protein